MLKVTIMLSAVKSLMVLVEDATGAAIFKHAPQW